MCPRKLFLLFVVLLAPAMAQDTAPVPEEIAPGVSVLRGPVNGVLIERDGSRLAIYGDPRPDPPAAEMILFTHHRRDVAWAGRALAAKGATTVGPLAEAPLFENVTQFWAEYRTSRFHDYANQSSRILTEPIPLARKVSDGEIIDWRGLPIHVLATPGYTRGAVSYLFEAGGKRIACAGDLIYGDGQLLDIYSLQDSVPEAKEDGYHGYAARAGQVVASLKKLSEWHPDLVIPARGPIVRAPQQAFQLLTDRLQALFQSHFSIDALRWYRGDDRLRIMAARVLGAKPLEWMPSAETVQNQLPGWIIPITNSRLIVSKTGAAFLVDCGNRQVVEAVETFLREGKIKSLDGIYITHYHDDHTDRAQELAEKFHCPVYATEKMRDILEHPEAYRMPCLSPNAIHKVTAMPDGERQKWNEFEFTYSYFPGQTLYHGGFFAAHEGGQCVLFVGDSFTPTGMDDYCLLNRNFLEPEEGFSQCLRSVRALPGDYLLINQHVSPAFRFSSSQIELMQKTFELRPGVVGPLVPWDDPNFGLDEQWVRLYPYTVETTAGSRVKWTAIVRNHSPREQTFVITPRLPHGWRSVPETVRLRLNGRAEGGASFEVEVPPGAAGPAVITADIAFNRELLRDWTEAIVTVR